MANAEALLLAPQGGDIEIAPPKPFRLSRLPLRFKLGIVGILVTLVAAFLVPPLFHLDPYSMSAASILSPPSFSAPMGTDSYGRSILARVLIGMRVSYEIGVAVSVATLIIGGGIGLVTGYWQRIDPVVMRVLDAIMALPAIMIALASATVFGASIFNTILVLTIVFSPRSARVMRSAVFSVREQLYVESARALGVGPWRIMLRHIVPNTVSPVIVQQTFTLALAILAEATFSFIGVGTPPPTPSLGNILSDSQSIMYQAPWVSVFPGALIAIIVMSVNFAGDGIRDWLDVRIREV